MDGYLSLGVMTSAVKAASGGSLDIVCKVVGGTYALVEVTPLPESYSVRQERLITSAAFDVPERRDIDIVYKVVAHRQITSGVDLTPNEGFDCYVIDLDPGVAPEQLVSRITALLGSSSAPGAGWTVHGRPGPTGYSTPTPAVAPEAIGALLRHVGGRALSRAPRESVLNRLVSRGTDVIGPLLDVVRSTGTDEVIRDAGMVLGRIASTAENLRALLEFTRDRSASVRATIAYALGEATAGESSRLRALSELVGDTTSADVRDAAVSALVQVGGLDAKRVLETSLERERNNLVRTALADAIAELE
jgi:hypothetical protein